ncbi:unnamed protein product [Didymodactylos carnosus]|uniref:Uncharacterized protein n=1 Tax=Didymodactylos carnosus TaxID=1234261 RepID=A0A814QTP9_9BILA|nr:unnamed protein product [Didymodactylos carnosus]CAF1124240.1 unnamed protein product [Didymodactylos carnosus]CAF3757688.1 unnamed protein product [Didymodactylos carnosus]CAF3887760.1 unnamed protein product [Didymodactylos carnosus]
MSLTLIDLIIACLTGREKPLKTLRLHAPKSHFLTSLFEQLKSQFKYHSKTTVTTENYPNFVKSSRFEHCWDSDIELKTFELIQHEKLKHLELTGIKLDNGPLYYLNGALKLEPQSTLSAVKPMDCLAFEFTYDSISGTGDVIDQQLFDSIRYH